MRTAAGAARAALLAHANAASGNVGRDIAVDMI
jgi:hypothetical protein